MLMIKRLMTRYIPGMLTCQEIDGFLYDFHAGNLSRTEVLKFKFHLSMCSECRKYIDNYKRTIELTKAEFQSPVTESKVPEDLVQAILKSRELK